MRLSESGVVKRNIAELSDEDDALIRLHEILFSNPGTKGTRKRKILDWSGSKGRHAELLAAITETPVYTVVKEICVMLEVEIGDSRPATQAALAQFLAAPTPTRLSAKEEDLTEDETEAASPTTSTASTYRGRKKGTRNRTKEEIEQARLEKLTRPRKPPGRKKGGRNNPNLPKKEIDPEKGRGRPRNFNEQRAFGFFIEKNFPNIFSQWREMTDEEKQEYWVKYVPK